MYNYFLSLGCPDILARIVMFLYLNSQAIKDLDDLTMGQLDLLFYASLMMTSQVLQQTDFCSLVIRHCTAATLIA